MQISNPPVVELKHIFQDRLFLTITFTNKYCCIIGEEGSLGSRFSFGFFCLEYYTTNNEPKLEKFAGLRLVIWSPLGSSRVPKKWIKTPIKVDSVTYACVDIRNKDDYWKSWSDTFKNYCSRWERQDQYTIREILYDEYRALYSKYSKPEKYIPTRLIWLEKYHRHGKTDVQFYILQHKVTGEIYSGLAVVDCFSVNQAYYISAFTRKEVAPLQSGLWLIKYWMDVSSKKGIHFANLGPMWTDGQPKEWKGFTEFKKKFNPLYISTERPLFRITFFS